MIPATVKRGGECGDQIEFAAERRQWFERLNRVDNAFDAEQLDQVVENRNAGCVETEAAMTLRLGDKEEKSPATTDIQDFPRGAAVQSQVLHAPDIQREIFFQIKVFRVMMPTAR